MCGDIRYEFTGPMFDVFHCHCESCRRHTSAPFATFFIVDKASFRYTRGTPVLYKSSPGVERTHCGRCGSPISCEDAREFGIYACTLEDLTLVRPQAHIMVGEMLPWLDFGDDLPCFEKGLHGGRQSAAVLRICRRSAPRVLGPTARRPTPRGIILPRAALVIKRGSLCCEHVSPERHRLTPTPASNTKTSLD
jgi:hypothetical protein